MLKQKRAALPLSAAVITVIVHDQTDTAEMPLPHKDALRDDLYIRFLRLLGALTPAVITAEAADAAQHVSVLFR